MPSKDLYHDTVKAALVREGWRILAENYALTLGGDRLYVDLAAEKPLALERDNEKILVEVKSFLAKSFFFELERAVGQYVIYRDILEERDLDFKLYLAVPLDTYNQGFQRQLADTIIRRNQIKLLVFDPIEEAVVTWIDNPNR
ncbi:MAG: XisH family protein [Phormidium sp.]|jgi:hypothetical protein